MKFKNSSLLIAACLLWASCQKNTIAPSADASKDNSAVSKSGSLVTKGTGADTAVNTHGYLKITLAMDTVSTDAALICFDPAAQAAFVKGEDAPYFQGFGQVSLSSFSSDKIALAINVLPLLQRGTSVGLSVSAKSDGNYKLRLDSVKAIPATYTVWLKDNYKKDSTIIKQSGAYAFSLSKADTASFGANRFRLVIR
jgi:hypothetical protein